MRSCCLRAGGPGTTAAGPPWWTAWRSAGPRRKLHFCSSAPLKSPHFLVRAASAALKLLMLKPREEKRHVTQKVIFFSSEHNLRPSFCLFLCCVYISILIPTSWPATSPHRIILSTSPLLVLSSSLYPNQSLQSCLWCKCCLWIQRISMPFKLRILATVLQTVSQDTFFACSQIITWIFSVFCVL